MARSNWIVAYAPDVNMACYIAFAGHVLPVRMGTGRDTAQNVPAAPMGGSNITALNAVVALMVGCGAFVRTAILARMGNGNNPANCAMFAPTVGLAIPAHSAKVVFMAVCGVFADFAMDVRMVS